MEAKKFSEHPDVFETEQELDAFMSEPYESVVGMMKNLDGDIMILGVGGKIGVHLAWAAKKAVERANVEKRIIGVSRFSDPISRKKLEDAGIETIACDLLDTEAISRLPRCQNVVFMAGRKFGTSDSEHLTWAMNTVVPANVARHFTDSKIVVYSTGCVYDLVPINSGGSTEEDVPNPIGEYAFSTLGRERVFEYYSQQNRTPMVILRLNYAIDLRYGVLREIGEKVLNNDPVNLTTACVNVMWQGDVINQSLLSFGLCDSPAMVLNITGPETVSIRYIAEQFGLFFNRTVAFAGEEERTALLNNAAKALDLFGYPRIPLAAMIRWTAHWLSIGGASLEKPTHFEVRNGRF